MKVTVPDYLNKGDLVKVIAPSFSLKNRVSKASIEYAIQIFNKFGLRVEFGDSVFLSQDRSDSFTVKTKVEDIHKSFLNEEVKCIIAAIGGDDCINLLDKIDWNLIRRNPKIFCGYSDITCLSNALYKKSGLLNFYGPNFSTFCIEHQNDYTINAFFKSVFGKYPITISPSSFYTDYAWWIRKSNPINYDNSGFISINRGIFEGVVIGGEIQSFWKLSKTQFFPGIKDKILFLENANLSVDEFYEKLIDFKKSDLLLARAIVIGRFRPSNNVNMENFLSKMTDFFGKKLIIANVDFGHTDPKITFPIGGRVTLDSQKEETNITINNLKKSIY